ncbi:MAG: hypothetical protein ABR585_10215, partial [Gemmatimonadaceae bacterium]
MPVAAVSMAIAASFVVFTPRLLEGYRHQIGPAFVAHRDRSMPPRQSEIGFPATRRQRMRIAKLVSVAAVVCSIAGCGGSGYSTSPVTTGPTVPPTDNGVLVVNNSFSPASRSVTAGTTITWTWATCSGGDGYTGQTCVSHDIVFDDGVTSGTKDSGTFQRTFATKGQTYNYHCSIH